MAAIVAAPRSSLPVVTATRKTCKAGRISASAFTADILFVDDENPAEDEDDEPTLGVTEIFN